MQLHVSAPVAAILIAGLVLPLAGVPAEGVLGFMLLGLGAVLRERLR